MKCAASSAYCREMFPTRFHRVLRVAASLAALLASSLAQIPQIQARNLSDKTVQLPDAVRGHVAVFVIGFTKASHTPASDWGKKLAQELSDCDCMFYQAAVLQDVPRLLRGMVVSGIRRSVPASQHDRFLLIYERQDEWKKLAQYSDRDAAYVIVFDAAGNAVWITHRNVNDTVAAELRHQISILKKVR
jgi:hypothetical protein